jgi:hypothetical protein
MEKRICRRTRIRILTPPTTTAIYLLLQRDQFGSHKFDRD